MKRSSTLFFAAALLLLSQAPASAQTKIALTGGATISSLDITTDDDFYPDFQSVTRLSIGLAATIPMSDGFGIQLGGAYSQKGGSLEFTEGGIVGESSIETDYLEFTALGKVGLPLFGDRASAYLLAGPALAFESSCQLRASATSGTESFEIDTDCDEGDLDRPNYDYGLAGGGGLEIGFTDKLGISLGLLYTYGLQDLDDNSGDSVKNRSLTLSGGFVFSIG